MVSHTTILDVFIVLPMEATCQMYFNYLDLINSSEHGPSWEVNSCLASQETPST
jgi:hypothetical protein